MGRLKAWLLSVNQKALETGLFVILGLLRVLGLARRKLVIAQEDQLYLTRWYLTPEGHWWRDRFPAVFLHCFHSSDPDRGFHSHPWIWAASLILNGWYAEERPAGRDIVDTFVYGPGDTNIIGQDDFHRVQLLTDRVWTLFVCGPLHGDEWEFLDEDGTLRPHGTETKGD